MPIDKAEGAPAESFLEAVLGKEAFHGPWAQRIASVPWGWRVVGAVAALGAVLYLPYLGAVGLWDPWETHYGEVARMMIQRRDYVHPYWENAWFFSKPPLTMWMDVLGMQVVGTNRTAGALALYTEWGMRLPFALISIVALCLLALALFRAAGARVALASTFALATMPLYWLLTRQAVTDTPFVCTQVAALACAMIAHFGVQTRRRAAYWYAFYVFCGLSTLAKGLMGFGVPAVVLVLYAACCEMPWDGPSLNAHVRWLLEPGFRREVKQGARPMPYLWAQLYRMKLLTGTAVFFATCGPWYAKLFAFQGVDDEGQKFWFRFLIHDHLERLASGVHTTTPGGTFVYFVEQGGYAMFPWVALLPGALVVAARCRLRGGSVRERVTVLAVVWAVLNFSLVAFSATKFHHYVFPILPPAAILIGLYVDRLWEEGVAPHAVTLLFGLVFFGLVGKDLAEHPKDFTDLFVYNYDRPYPTELVERPAVLFGRRMLWMGDLLSAFLLAVGAYQVYEAFRSRRSTAGGRTASLAMLLAGAALFLGTTTRGAPSPTLLLGIAAALCAAYQAYGALRAPADSRKGLLVPAAGLAALGILLILSGAQARVDELVGWLTQPVNVKSGMGMAFLLGGAVCAVAALLRARVMLFASFWVLAFGFAFWFNSSHWVSLSHHWTQRDQFWRYYSRREGTEPIAAFLMNWRGETFYSRNTVKQIKDNGMLARYAALPGRKWALVEHYRIGVLRGAVGGKTVTPVAPGLNNKFVLVTIE